MSTVKTNNSNSRIALLYKMNEQVFHADDLRKLWNIKEKNTLHTTLARYARAGLLNRVYRGLYSIVPVNEIDPYLLGAKALHRFCYVSAETILIKNGNIQQNIEYITLISDISKKFSTGVHSYYSRQLKDEYLHQDIGLETDGPVKLASPERAAADLLYFNPNAHLDNKKNLNWPKIRKIQKTIGYPASLQ